MSSKIYRLLSWRISKKEDSLVCEEYGDPFNEVDGGPLVVRFNQHEPYIPITSALTKVGDFLEHYYDFGNGWQHLVSLEAILPEVPADLQWKPRKGEGFAYELLEAKRKCPPENCGGYRNYLEICKSVKAGNLDDWRVQRLDEWELENWKPSKASQKPGVVQISHGTEIHEAMRADFERFLEARFRL